MDADAAKLDIDELIRATDSVADIQNTVRYGSPVRLIICSAGLRKYNTKDRLRLL